MDALCPTALVRARTKLDIGFEAGCGLRVGEALGGGDYHGVLAGNCFALREISTGLMTVDVMLEHSKTHFKRWTGCLGETLGDARLPLDRLLREYWQAAGMQTYTYVEGGHEITTVDYFVIRVSLLGMTAARFGALERVLRLSAVPAMRKAVKATMARAQARLDAKWSKDKKYINVFGGTATDEDLTTVFAELQKAGFGSFTTKCQGPLMRSMDGSGWLSHMPVDPSTTYASLHRIMDVAYERANPPGDPDPWLDLQGLDAPLWGHHSWRRLADTVARATMAKSGVSEQDIDLVFGWLEKMYSQRMQYHYETRFNRSRRYRVTMYL